MSQRKVTILGSTGSIGKQALDVIEQHPEEFSLYALVCNNNVELLIEQAKKFKPEFVIINNKAHYKELRRALKDDSIEVDAGREAVVGVAGAMSVDIVLNALVGFAGLAPTIKALERGTTVALANKETLVVAGELVRSICKRTGAMLLPVDSEHSAIFQCLTGESKSQVSKLYLTASGGPFVDTPASELVDKKAEEALKHPVWSMGTKVTIDSATLMNKGLEMIEAHHLFDIPAEDIEVLVHRQGIVHSMVGYQDGAIKAQLSLPDMRLPIAYALLYPNRQFGHTPLPRIDQMQSLTFEPPRFADFPCLKLAYEALDSGGCAPCVMNAANEIAVERFMKGQIKFTDIPKLIRDTMLSCDERSASSYEMLRGMDTLAREKAQAWYIH